MNWQGFYVGGQVSYGSVTSKMDFSGVNSDLRQRLDYPTWRCNVSISNWPPLGSAHGNATGFGAFVGYNSQWDDVVVGFEANYIHGKFAVRQRTRSRLRYESDDVTLQSVTEFERDREDSRIIGSLRVRGGYVMGCFLPYLFAGIALGQAEIARRSYRFGVAGTATAPLANVRRQRTTHNCADLGYTAGARHRRDAGRRPVRARRIGVSSG